MDLIHPTSTAEVVDAVRDAGSRRHRLLIVGGRRHIDKGNPVEVDAEIWTTQLDRLVAYEPAEMVVVVEAGMRIGELNRILAAGGQEWPSDAPADATVGGVVASGTSSPRRLKMGALRDTVLEAEIVTGDGKVVRSGARTVKNVTGYDVHRLVAGSLGTLGVIVQVALKVRPLAEARRTLRFEGDLAFGEEIVRTVPGATATLAMRDVVDLRLEGWREEVEEQTSVAGQLDNRPVAHDELAFPSDRPWEASPVVVEASVPPSALAGIVAGPAWGALVGVGIAWIGLGDAEGDLDTLRDRVRAAGGIAPVVQGPGGLGPFPIPAPMVHRRLKHAFDPGGILAPGRGWAGL